MTDQPVLNRETYVCGPFTGPRMHAQCSVELRRSRAWCMFGAAVVLSSMLAFYLFGATWARLPALIGIGLFLMGAAYGGAARRIRGAGK